ncbi:MAG: release factor glutamine methyltransferase [Solirubrobacteraceae bacterium]|jgi:release factor glutamine methyltransferase|nr:release factor glutamine methyltransferase [Solirubrobacteraceae bacterium]
MNGAPSTGTSAAEAEQWAADALTAAGCPDPRSDAELLVADALAVAHREAEAELSPGEAAALRSAVARRARREPLGYVRGSVRFRGLEIAVDDRVFIPRPETEPLVEAALAIPRGARVLEPCTGSGAVALALKHERPDLTVTGTDRSADALAVARANAARLGLAVSFFEADGIAAAPGGPYDAVVANPPYVAEADAAAAGGTLPPELEHHEPPGAFWAGRDGLSTLRRFTRELDGVRWVAFEVGDGQARAVGTMLNEAGFARLSRRTVPSGQTRVVIAERAW